MKCPKCGYNSFEENNACPKCSADLISFKNTYGLSPLLFSQASRTAMAQEFINSMEAEVQSDDTESATDMFSFDMPDEPPAIRLTKTPATNNDPFNFDDTPSPSTIESNAFSFDDEPSPADDPFASLLESTSQSENDPFAGLSLPPQTAQTQPSKTNTSTAGEFDLNSFSWDEPAPTETAAAQSGQTEDKLDSLFGDLENPFKK